MTLDKSLSSLGLGFFICRKGFQVPILGPENKLEARHNLKEDQQQKTEPKNPAHHRVWPCFQIQFLNSGEGNPPPHSGSFRVHGYRAIALTQSYNPLLLNPK